MVTFLTDGVDLVDPVGQVGGGGVGTQDHMAVESIFQHLGGADDVLFAEDGLGIALGLVQDAGFVVDGVFHLDGHGAGGRVLGHAPVGHKQLGDLLMHRKLFDVGGRTLGGGAAPVVDGADGTAAVNILEGQTVLVE